MNGYAVLADLIAATHLAYVSFVILGLLIVLIGSVLRWQFVRNFWFRTTHLAMILIVVFEAVMGIMCPLTVWEYQLRVAAGRQDISDGSFVARLVHNLMFFDLPPMAFTIGYCLFGLAVLASWWFIPPQWPWNKNSKNNNDEQLDEK